MYQGDHFGRQRCDPGEFPRHRHSFGYVCLILGGGFLEAGDLGRFRARPGDVLVHRPFEAHLNLLGARSSDVLNLPLVDGFPDEGWIQVEDADLIARIAECDPYAASRAVIDSYSIPAGDADWPDMLAVALRQPGHLSIGLWASRHGLTPAAVSRGFRQAYGTTPARYRAEARARRAWRAVANDDRPLADIAFDLGFADQAHMTRSLTEITGRSPGKWRRQGQLSSRPA